jgi:hypothetical protein
MDGVDGVDRRGRVRGKRRCGSERFMKQKQKVER